MSDIVGDPYNFGLFASGEDKRDAALRANDARVSSGRGGDRLVAQVTRQLMDRVEFTADDVAHLLDEAGVSRDLATRRRLTSVVVNRGKGKLWEPVGYAISQDARRNARPVMRWKVRAA